MLKNVMAAVTSLPGIEPFYGLALTFYPKITLYTQPNITPLLLSPSQQNSFDRIKEGIGLQGEIALYQENTGRCLPTNRWTPATPVLFIHPQFVEVEDWNAVPIAYSLGRALTHIKHHHGFSSYLAWSICLVVGAYFGLQKKRAGLFVLAYFIGKYFYRKIQRMQIEQADTELFALYNTQQLKVVQEYFEEFLHDFQDWRKKSLWRRLVYLPTGAARSGRLFWEHNMECLVSKLEKIKVASLKKVAEEKDSTP